MKRRRLNGAKMRVQSFRLRLVLIPIQGGCGLELTLPQALTGPGPGVFAKQSSGAPLNS